MLSKAWYYYCQYGLRALIWRIYRRRRFVIFIKDHADAAEPATHDDVTFHLAGPADVAVLSDFLSASREASPEEEIRRRLSSGDLAIVGILRDTGRIGCVNWISRDDRLFHTQFGATPPNAEACSRKIYVPEHFRRRHLAARGVLYAEWAARRAGYQRLWAYVLRGNRPSLRLHSKLGYGRYGILRLGRIWGRRFAEMRRSEDRSWVRLQPVTADGAEHEILEQDVS